MPTSDVRKQVAVALKAVQNKKAEDVAVLQLPSESSTFTDYFLICSGQNPPQVQAIADAVDERLSKGLGVEPNTREGYENAEWILLDYVDFVVHIFNAQRRAYYDLERLWKSAHRLTASELLHPRKAMKAASTTTSAKRPAKKTARKSPKKTATKTAKKKVAKKAAKKASATGRRSTTKAAAAKTKVRKTSTATAPAKKKSAKRG